MTRKGKMFEAEVSKSLKSIESVEPYFFYRRLLDSARVGMRVPADFLVIHAGKARLFECKSSKQKVSFPFRNVAEHQIFDLLEAEEAGAISWLLIKHSCRKPTVYAIPIKSWIRLIDNPKRKSITWDDLDKEADTILRKNKDNMWELWSLFILD